jgi:hypothetical protein
LIEELQTYAPEELRGNLNRLVTTALREYADRRRREAFSSAMAEMAADPAVQSECRTIAEEFRSAEDDGLKTDGHPKG